MDGASLIFGKNLGPWTFGRLNERDRDQCRVVCKLWKQTVDGSFPVVIAHFDFCSPRRLNAFAVHFAALEALKNSRLSPSTQLADDGIDHNPGLVIRPVRLEIIWRVEERNWLGDSLAKPYRDAAEVYFANLQESWREREHPPMHRVPWPPRDTFEKAKRLLEGLKSLNLRVEKAKRLLEGLKSLNLRVRVPKLDLPCGSGGDETVKGLVKAVRQLPQSPDLRQFKGLNLSDVLVPPLDGSGGRLPDFLLRSLKPHPLVLQRVELLEKKDCSGWWLLLLVPVGLIGLWTYRRWT
jgi:hypothetical protein